MTKAEAKELCIKKWEYIVNNNGKGLTDKQQKEFIKYLHCCAYCQLYFNKDCHGCPIDIDKNGKIGCYGNNHPYVIWESKKTKKNAQAVLKLIKNS